ncbi:hypothetical protein [Arthrobacter sp. SO3]|uniref:hypothetical protein n=1 Tax=Arthrobacter sp. SO3 TaxID=1897057 RepID=UPI001CFF5816|nr:hypothetical protein [Arthrobacter sp. SO3]MCB5293157.1 hypothetical protein [Arthrobacter sp. SO3]
MNVGEWLLRCCAALTPAASRDRHREEWLADARHARELSMSPSAVVRGAARATLSAQKERLLLSSDDSPRQLTRRGASAVIVSLALFILSGLIGISVGALALWAVALFIAFVGFTLLARAASNILGSGRAPWTLFVATAACPLVPLVAVIETNQHFNAFDSHVHSGTYTGVHSGLVADFVVFVALTMTGAAGVTALLTSILLSLALLVKLAKARTSRGPGSPDIT